MKLVLNGGGNTYKLLDCLKKNGAFEKIRRYLLEDDGIVYGGSAGAIIFGKDLDSCNTDDDKIKFIGPKMYSEFINGTEKMMFCDDAIELVPYADEDYEFVYEIKKNV